MELGISSDHVCLQFPYGSFGIVLLRLLTPLHPSKAALTAAGGMGGIWACLALPHSAIWDLLVVLQLGQILPAAK